MNTLKIFVLCFVFFALLPQKAARAWPCAADDSYVQELVKKSDFVVTGVAGEYTSEGTPLKLTQIYKATGQALVVGSTVYLNKPYFVSWWDKLFDRRVISSNEPRFMAGTEYLIIAPSMNATETGISVTVDQCSYQKTIAFQLSEIRNGKGDSANAGGLFFTGKVKKTFLLGGQDMTTTYTIVQFDVLEFLNQVKFVKTYVSMPLSVAVPACGRTEYFAFNIPVGGTYLAYATNSRELRLRLPFHAEEGKVPAEFGDVTLMMDCTSLVTLDEDLKLKKFSEKE